jgi:hypothetical protein
VHPRHPKKSRGNSKTSIHHIQQGKQTDENPMKFCEEGFPDNLSSAARRKDYSCPAKQNQSIFNKLGIPRYYSSQEKATKVAPGRVEIFGLDNISQL